MTKTWCAFCLPLLLILSSFSTGCASRRAAEIEPLSARELEQFFTRAQDERRFWLTRYESDQGPVFAGAHRLHTEKFAHVAFESRRNVPVPMIAVRLRTPEEYAALIDTSARSSWIEFRMAHEMGLIPIGPPSHRQYAAHVNDPIPGYLSVAPRLIIDQMHVDTALVYVKAAHGPLALLTREEKDLRAPIVLGGEFLRAFHFVQIDYPNRTILFSTTTPYRTNADRLIASVPMRSYNGSIAVEGFFDQQESLFLLDSLGDFAVASSFAPGETVQQVMIGHLVMRNVPHTNLATLGLGFPDVPRIGRHVLSRYIVTIDGKNRLVHFERP